MLSKNHRIDEELKVEENVCVRWWKLCCEKPCSVDRNFYNNNVDYDVLTNIFQITKIHDSVAQIKIFFFLK
jgi:hypothetical protein